MSDFIRIRELAVLLRPKASVSEASNSRVHSFDEIQTSLRGTIKSLAADLKHDIGEGGQLESLLKSKGLLDLADEHGTFKNADAKIDALIDEFSKKVMDVMVEAEFILASAE